MKRILSLILCAMILTAGVIVSIPASAADDFYTTAELLEIKEHIEDDAGMNEYATVQGACTDGKYAYFAVQNGATVILKYSLKNWELVDSKRYAGELGHANDMTYNPARNLILVANNGPDYKLLTGIDPDTLEIRGTAKLKIEVYSIAYNPARDIYVAGISGSYNFALLDNRFKVIKKFKGRDTGYTRQGCDCDDDYIYFSQSGGDNAVVVYDYDGRYVDIVSLGHTHEVENLFHIGSSFYTTLHYYGNSVQRLGLSKNRQITYNVYYDPGEGYGEMKATRVHYGTNTPLRANTFKKANYFFGGWRASRSIDGKYLGYRKFAGVSEWLDEEDVYEYDLYQDMDTVAKTVKFGSITLTPFWIRDQYVIRYDPAGAEGWMPEATVNYYDDYYIPENGHEMAGYIFAGFTAYRDYDNKFYGYRKNGKIAEWLEPQDLYKKHEFKPGETVSSLTYDGVVTLSPEFRFAYTYSDDNSALVEYIGYEEIVDIPNPSGNLKTIATGAFKDNFIFTELHIPETVENMEPQAAKTCSLLERVYFKDNFPDHYADDCFVDCETPSVLIDYDGRLIHLGYAGGSIDAQFVRFTAGAMRLALSQHHTDNEKAAAE